MITIPEVLISSDNRKHRKYSPVTEESIINRWELVSSRVDFTNKSVLDIGCCVGTYGYLTLKAGARHYTGIDIQKRYIDIAEDNLRELLVNVDSNVTLIHGTVDDISGKFDIVLFMGCLFTYLDPFAILKKITDLASESVVIDTVNPAFPDYVNQRSIITLDDRANGVNLSSAARKIKGNGCRTSPSALAMIMGIYGFHSREGALSPKPLSRPGDIDLYHQTPAVRYFMFFENSGEPDTDVFLTQHLLNIEFNETPVTEYKSVSFFAPIAPGLNKLEQGSWAFNQIVSDNFDQIAYQHIPYYNDILSISASICDAEFGQPCHDKSSVRILDFGCATGRTLKAFRAKGYTNLIGIDNSEAMLSKVADNLANLILASEIPAHIFVDFLVCNWTLHFTQNKLTLLRNFYEHLNPGGMLVLTEKLHQTAAQKSLYYKYKSDKGVSLEEIQAKEQQLEGVLFPETETDLLNLLIAAGFTSYERIFSAFGFTTYLIRKPALADSQDLTRLQRDKC